MLDRVFAKGPIHPATYDQAAAMRRASGRIGLAEPGAQMLDDAHAPRNDAAAHWPQPLDLRALAQRAPQRPQFIVPDWLPAGYATLLAGHGGVGKSAIALHLAVCIAKGCDFFGLPCAQRRVLYLSCEDRERILHWRLARICALARRRHG
jgi:hypothetical protein